MKDASSNRFHPRADLADGRSSIYQHDTLGQVVSGKRFWSDGTLMAGQDFDYKFDDIGNRDTTGGRASAVSDYTANQLNQYTTRTVANQLDVLGIANPNAGVQVWKDADSPSFATQKGEYFHHALTAGWTARISGTIRTLIATHSRTSSTRTTGNATRTPPVIISHRNYDLAA